MNATQLQKNAQLVASDTGLSAFFLEKTVIGRTKQELHADATGNPPAKIMLMQTGTWNAPWHGDFEMTPADLAEMVIHFEDGEAQVQGSKKLPINYGHDISGKAAGWITKVYLDGGGTELWGDVDWTPEGVRMLKEGEFKYISPEWNPRALPYQDPEDENRWLSNVFTGAGLTNIPLFKKLKPVMASIVAGSSDKPNEPEGGDMKLEEVLAKKADERTDEEKAFLEEHKDELTDEQRKDAGLEDQTDADEKAKAEAKAKADKEAADKAAAEEAGKQAAGTPQGLTAAQQAEWAQMRADAQAGREAQRKLLENELRASVKSHVDRGAIKSSELDSTVEMLMASSDDARKRQLDFISKLPDNSLLASESGKSTTETAAVEITKEDLELAESFGNTKEDLENFKKAQAQS